MSIFSLFIPPQLDGGMKNERMRPAFAHPKQRRARIHRLCIGAPVLSGLLRPERLPFPNWIQMVIITCCHARFSHKGISSHLQRTHAWRIQDDVRAGLHSSA